MGTDVSQALVGSGSYRKINLLTYFREGHVQMKVRFPKAGLMFTSGLCPLARHLFLLSQKHLHTPEHDSPADP